jgi:hypothetical protein
MEELTGILFVVAAIILMVVEAKFKKAAKKPAPKVQTQEVFPEVTDHTGGLPKWLEDMERELRQVEPQPEPVKPQPEPVVPPPVEVKPEPVSTITFAEAQKPMKKVPLKPVRKPILQDEEKKTSEKIDPRKLIVYSEIMNRKY